jgi:hypothetical protein
MGLIEIGLACRVELVLQKLPSQSRQKECAASLTRGALRLLSHPDEVVTLIEIEQCRSLDRRQY